MKQSALIFAAFSFVIGSLLSCYSPAEKVENAKTEVADAKEDLKKANQEYLDEINRYRRTSAEKIDANNESIAEFKRKVTYKKKNAKVEYSRQIANLEVKNRELKRKMDEYKEEGKEKWEIFKKEFNHDLAELDKSLKDFTVKNVK